MPGFRILRDAEAFAYDPSSKRTKRIEDPAHLAFIRKLPSVLSGQYGCDPCHIRTGSALHRKKWTGGAQKPDDCWTVPLTRSEHDSQHSANELGWWKSHGIDPFELAVSLYEVSGDIEAGTAILRKARP